MTKRRFFGSIALTVALVVGALSFALVGHAHAQAPHTPASVGHGMTVHPSGRSIGAARLVPASAIPQAPATPVTAHPSPPAMTPWGPTKAAQLKAAASKPNPATNFGPPIAAVPPVLGSTKAPTVPGLNTTFSGIGYTGNVFSDTSMSAGDGFVVESVDSSFAVYNVNGTLQSGWPKTAQSFFGLSAHNLYYSRVAFDPGNGGHFIVLYDDYSSPANHWYYQLAISATDNPTGGWWLYNDYIDTIEDAGTASAAFSYLPQIGFDAEGLYFTGDHYNFSTFAFQGAFLSWMNKATMEAGSGSSFYQQINDLTEGDGLVSLLAPAISFGAPRAELFVATDTHSSNIYNIWAISNPLFIGGVAYIWTYQYANISFAVPPDAFQPGDSSGSVNTGLAQITSSPVWRDGILTFTFTSGVTQGSTSYAGVLFLRLGITLSDGNNTSCYPTTNRCVTIDLVYGLENGAIQYSGAYAFFPSLAVDTDGNTIFTYTYSSTSRYPSAVVYSRRSTTDRQDFGAPGATYGLGTAYYTHLSWGNYSAAAIDPSACGATGCYKIWVVGDYSNGDWATKLTSVAYTLGDV